MDLSNLTRDQYDQLVIGMADRYVVSAFLGSGRFTRVRVATLGEARSVAARLYVGRPIAIYAVAGDYGTHLENYEPAHKYIPF